MTLADVRIILVFALILGFIAIFPAAFGIKGTHFILTVSAFVNAFFAVFSLIANGKL